MTYTELLNELLDKSGKSQKEIADECTEKYEVKLTSTYLSGLKTSKGKIASDEISRAIAKACNASYEEILVVQAYLDKAPEIIIEFVEAIRKNNEIGADFFGMMDTTNNDIAAKLVAGMREKGRQSLAEFICETVADNEETEETFPDLQKQWEKAQAIQNSKWLVIPPEGAREARYIDENEIKKIIKIDPTE